MLSRTHIIVHTIITIAMTITVIITDQEEVVQVLQVMEGERN